MSSKEFNSTENYNPDSVNSEQRILEELQNFESYYDQVEAHQVVAPALPSNIRVERQMKIIDDYSKKYSPKVEKTMIFK